MHYKNGRIAKNGDKIVMFRSDGVILTGYLHGATPGNDTCNGSIAVQTLNDPCTNLSECLHADDVAAALNGQIPNTDAEKMPSSSSGGTR